MFQNALLKIVEDIYWWFLRLTKHTALPGWFCVILGLWALNYAIKMTTARPIGAISIFMFPSVMCLLFKDAILSSGFIGIIAAIALISLGGFIGYKFGGEKRLLAVNKGLNSVFLEKSYHFVFFLLFLISMSYVRIIYHIFASAFVGWILYAVVYFYIGYFFGENVYFAYMLNSKELDGAEGEVEVAEVVVEEKKDVQKKTSAKPGSVLEELMNKKF